jgi:uncharacterized membrane protein
MATEFWVISVFWIILIVYGLYKRRFILTLVFIFLLALILLFSYLYDDRDYRMHVAVYGTISIYLLSVLFLMFLLFKGSNKQDE